MKIAVQVDKSHYSMNYDNIETFCRYYKIIEAIKKIKPKNILEVGVGNKVLYDYFMKNNISIASVDIDPELNPDYISDIRYFYSKNKYEVIIVSEVLEHIPFYDFEKTINNLANLTKDYVIICLPYNTVNISFAIKLPFLKTQFLYFHFFEQFFITHKFNGEHYWEMGKKHFSKNRILTIIQKKFIMIDQYPNYMDPYHYFFILKKRK